MTPHNETTRLHQGLALTRRRFIISAFGGALGASLLVACGGDDDDGEDGEEGAAPEDATGAFPVTLDHKYVSTTISKKPSRVACVGLVEQDALLALGITPVATREWFGEQPGAILPWATEALGENELPTVLSAAELDFEAIAALQPDVIIGFYAGLTQEEYGLLTEIAPTVAQPPEYVDFGISWQELTVTTGKIVGMEARAQELVAGVEERFEAAKQEHPAFEGAEIVLASTFGEGSFWVYGPEDPRVRFLSDLGFATPPDVVARVEGSGEWGADISDEQVALVDADAVIWFVESEAEAESLKADPVYSGLDVAREGRHLFMTTEDAGYQAYNFNTVLSLPYALDEIVPQLAEILG